MFNFIFFSWHLTGLLICVLALIKDVVQIKKILLSVCYGLDFEGCRLMACEGEGIRSYANDENDENLTMNYGSEAGGGGEPPCPFSPLSKSISVLTKLWFMEPLHAYHSFRTIINDSVEGIPRPLQ